MPFNISLPFKIQWPRKAYIYQQIKRESLSGSILNFIFDLTWSSIIVPVATFVMAVICGTDKLRCDLFLNMLLVSVGVVISSYGEIHFNVIGTVYQVTGIFAEALRLVLTQVLLQKKGLTLNPVTSLYYIAPCR